MAAVRTAARKAANDAVEAKRYIRLSGLPRTALPTDLRRLCGKSKVENVVDAGIHYTHFRPTGVGYLSFSRPEYSAAAAKALNKAVVGGKMVTAQSVATIPERKRSRGTKGLLEAAQRGVINGSGIGGGITGSGRNVVLFGLPEKLIPFVLADNLRQFKLAETEHGREVVVKLESDNSYSKSSRFLVRTTSVSEACRLVRKMHMTPWRPDMFKDRYIVRAFVIW
ncbi:hypothetical protein BD413DRAFT_608095 [Trametes elegans]|nr:hypothetical protein BD413DRAFT_608095 [Trametes elegans]